MLDKEEIKSSIIKTTPKKELNFPIINIRRVISISESTVNYFILGLCFAIYGFIDIGWFGIGNPNFTEFKNGIFLLSGICLGIIGLFDWYNGRTISFLIDFNFGLLFISYYLYSLGSQDDLKKFEAVLYILFFIFIFCVLICSKDKGILFIFDYVVLFIGYVFLFVRNYWETYRWLRNITCYIFLVMTAFFWVTGILKLLNDLSLYTGNPLVEPPA